MAARKRRKGAKRRTSVKRKTVKRRKATPAKVLTAVRALSKRVTIVEKKCGSVKRKKRKGASRRIRNVNRYLGA
jgi:hypothetical protein